MPVRILKSFKLISISLLLGSLACSSAFGKRETILARRDIVISRVDASLYPDPATQKDLEELRPLPELSADQLQRILFSFAFKDGDQEISVFRHTELKPVSLQVLEAIKRLNANDRLIVVSRHDKKEIILNRPDRTSMLIWNDASGLNFVFGTIREDMLDGSDQDRDAWKDIASIPLNRSKSEYSLLPSPFYTLRKLKSGETHPTWAVFTQAQLASLPQVPDSAASVAKKEEKVQPVDLTQKLAELKKAFDQGLITKDEYETKRKEILGKY
ncbi:MAG: SHOCT domain-containing protein [Spirochaetia bacterium]|nr:SHOCT domain-containing protein [Spirochaetia bacterium]